MAGQSSDYKNTEREGGVSACIHPTEAKSITVLVVPVQPQPIPDCTCSHVTAMGIPSALPLAEAMTYIYLPII